MSWNLYKAGNDSISPFIHSGFNSDRVHIDKPSYREIVDSQLLSAKGYGSLSVK